MTPGEVVDSDPGADDDALPLVRVILGPTGSGKTEIAARLNPERYEIVSCDSRQVYREMPVGTAMPEPEVLARIPHHLVDFLSPLETIDAGMYARMADAAITDILARGRKPVLVGGAGFYYRALKTGLFDRARIDPAVRERVRMTPHRERLARLRAEDPDALQSETGPALPGRIHPNDEYRVERALEVLESTGTRFSEHWRRAREAGLRSRKFRFSGYHIETEREEYFMRLELRVQAMLQAGLVEEAERIRSDYGDCPGLATLGYDLALNVVDGLLPVGELASSLAIGHRQYGKRQRTWFRRETELRAISREELRKKVADGAFPDEFLGISDN